MTHHHNIGGDYTQVEYQLYQFIWHKQNMIRPDLAGYKCEDKQTTIAQDKAE